MTEEATIEPLVPADCDCTDLDGFMLNVERLMASELVALSVHEVVAAALFLWCRSWKQVPAASLPDDERVIAAFARLPIAKFRRIRSEVMRGFVKCSDGRFYHKVLAAEALKAWGRKLAFQKRRDTDAERLRKWRASHGETSGETHDETRFVQEGQGQGQGQGLKKESKKSSLRSHKENGAKAPSNGEEQKIPRASRLPEGWEPFDENYDLAISWGLIDSEIRTEHAKFTDYWTAKSGKDATKTDWDATWRNWMRKAADDKRNKIQKQRAFEDRYKHH